MVVSKKVGFTLVELLIALALGSALLLSLSKLVVTSNKVFAVQTERAIRAENIRFALHIMRQDLMNAGFVGCFDWNKPHQFVNYINPTDTQLVVGKKDSIEIRYAVVDTMADITEPQKSGDNRLWVDKLSLKEQQIAVVSDCEHAVIFLVTEVHARGVIKFDAEFNHLFDKTISSVYRMERVNYSARNGFLRRNGEPWIEGVTDLQFQYDVDGGGCKNIVRFTLTFEDNEKATDTVKLRNYCL